MIIDLEKFRLAIRPNKDVLREQMLVCRVDGWPADHADVQQVFKAEGRKAEYWGISDSLISQAALWHSQDDETLAQETLAEGLKWGRLERELAAKAAANRVEVEDNPDFQNSDPWVEMRKVDGLAKLGEKVVTYVDYPLEAAWAFHGWDVTVGKPEFIPPEANQHDDLVIGLIGVSMTVNRMSAPENFDKKYKPDMRVSWHHKSGGTPEWGGKELFALGIIRSF